MCRKAIDVTNRLVAEAIFPCQMYANIRLMQMLKDVWVVSVR